MAARELTHEEHDTICRIVREQAPRLGGKWGWFEYREDDSDWDSKYQGDDGYLAIATRRSGHALSVYHALQDEGWDVAMEQSYIDDYRDCVVLLGIECPDWLEPHWYTAVG